MNLKKLTKKAVNQVLKSMSLDYRAQLNRKYQAGTNFQDRMGFPFEEFITDFVYEVAYRAGCEAHGFEKDGNWIEFEAQWKLTEGDYKFMKELMTNCGWNAELMEW